VQRRDAMGVTKSHYLLLAGRRPTLLALFLALLHLCGFASSGAPLLFLHGLPHVHNSSEWTLTYRELRAAEGVACQMTPKVALDGV
jgi:hypothetical protein